MTRLRTAFGFKPEIESSKVRHLVSLQDARIFLDLVVFLRIGIDFRCIFKANVNCFKQKREYNIYELTGPRVRK